MTDGAKVLHDPSVASAPVEKKIAFLQSKQLTPDEIDASLSRASQGRVPPPYPAYGPAYGQNQWRPQAG